MRKYCGSAAEMQEECFQMIFTLRRSSKLSFY